LVNHRATDVDSMDVQRRCGVKLNFHGSSFLAASSRRGCRACPRARYDDATRKLLPRNSSFSEEVDPASLMSRLHARRPSCGRRRRCLSPLSRLHRRPSVRPSASRRQQPRTWRRWPCRAVRSVLQTREIVYRQRMHERQSHNRPLGVSRRVHCRRFSPTAAAAAALIRPAITSPPSGGLCSTAEERRPLAGKLSLSSCTRPAVDGWPLLWIKRPLHVSQPDQLSLSFFWRR